MTFLCALPASFLVRGPAVPGPARGPVSDGPVRRQGLGGARSTKWKLIARVLSTRECLDHMMVTSEQRTRDALVSLQQMLQAQCTAPDPNIGERVDTLKTNIADLERAARAVDTASTAEESLAAMRGLGESSENISGSIDRPPRL